MRCERELRARGAEKFGTKVEVKNMNSFRLFSARWSMRSSGRLARSRRRNNRAGDAAWKRCGGRTESMRSKECAHDYRYFPDPDLLPVIICSDAKQYSRRCRNCRMRSARDSFKISGSLHMTPACCGYPSWPIISKASCGLGRRERLRRMDFDRALRRLNERGKGNFGFAGDASGLAGLIGK